MKKSAFALLLTALIALCLCAGCADAYPIPEKPDDTSLEFWIAQDVSAVDFSEYYEVPGWFGGQQFYGKEYQPEEVDENGFAVVEPQYCVKYFVGAYPDAADGGQFVTQIDITDPHVVVYGLSCDSTLAEFDGIMKGRGYTISEDSAAMHTATLGRIRFVLVSFENEHRLSIRAKVTNRSGIVY